jgi:hypothetical protein
MFKKINMASSILLMASLVASTPVAQSQVPNVAPGNATIGSIEANQDCGVHIREAKGPGWEITYIVYAPETEGHNMIARGGGFTGYGHVNIAINRISDWFLVISKKWNNDSDDTLQISYGGESFDVWDNRCSVGGWDGDTRQMDCRFGCGSRP